MGGAGLSGRLEVFNPAPGSSHEHPELRRHRRVKEYWQLVSVTAQYRYRICWDGARRVMTERGYDPLHTILATCDQGDDVNATFILPDGGAVSCDFREDSTTRQAVGCHKLGDDCSYSRGG